MGKIARITVDGLIEKVDIEFDEKQNDINKKIHELIGNGCTIYNTLPPLFLNRITGTKLYPQNKKDTGIIMLIDEEAGVKEAKINAIGSLLADSKDYDDTILGDCLIVGTKYVKTGDIDEIDFCEVPEDILEFIIAIVDSFTKKFMEQLTLDNTEGNKCIACIKLNKENGNTLPVYCGRVENLCIALNERYLSMDIKDAVDELSKYIYSQWIEKAFDKCWDNNNMSELLSMVKQMMESAGENVMRVDMDNMCIFEKKFIDESLKMWEILVKSGNKDVYTYERQ